MKAFYVKTQLKSVVNISRIVTIHYYEFWEMVYVDTGRVEVCRDNETITLSQGEVVFHRPNEFHSIRALDSSPNFFVVSFVCSSPAMQYFEKYHTTLDKTLKSFISSVIKESESTYVIPKNDTELKRLHKKENAPIGGDQLIKTYLEQLLIFLLRGITKKGEVGAFPSKESLESHLVTAIKELIEQRLDQRPSVQEICRALGYSKSYLSKLFREQSGETIAGYATGRKIRRAKQMIREGNSNFTQISDRLCFDNPQYFSRVFKRVTGMTPTEFKQSLIR